MLPSPPETAPTLQRSLPRLLDTLSSTCRPATLARGRAYEEQGRVARLELRGDEARAEVHGSDDATYEVRVDLVEGRSSCNCGEWGSWDDHCKHVAALAYALDRRSSAERAPRAMWAQPAPPPPVSTAPSEPRLQQAREWLGLPVQGHSFVFDLALDGGLTLGVRRAERPKEEERWAQVAPYLNGRMLEPADRRIFRLINGLHRDPEGRYHLPAPLAGPILESLRSRPITVAGKRGTLAEHPAHLLAEIGQTERTRTVTLRLRLGDGALVNLGATRAVAEAPIWLLHGTNLHRLETGAPLERVEQWLREPELTMPRDDSGALDFVLGGLRRLGVILDATSEIAPERPVFVLTLDGDRESVRAMLGVRYGGVELPLSTAGATTHVTTDGRLLRREPAAEAEAIRTLVDAGLSQHGGAFVARGDRAVEFWTRAADSLPADWIYFGAKPHQVVSVRPLAPRVALSQGSNGWFSLEIAFAHEDHSVDLAKLRPLLATGRRYVALSDGQVGELPRELCEHIRSMLEETGAEPDEEGRVALAPAEAGELERLVGLVPDAQVAPETRRFLAALRDFHGIDEEELPAGLKAELRPYQKRGFDWLMFLHRHALAGVLADDMGLGKTVQALALLLRLKKDEGRAPSLVVAPTSVLPNWQREVERFAPGLKAVLYDGPERERRLSTFRSADVVLVSYALLRRDAELLRKIEFRYVILDEAQHVKNPTSLGARAARSLKCQRRLALTGTPLENRLSDLWALFQFLMPGFLGNEGQFRTRYVRPIEGDGNAGVRDRLRRRVHPFILRRLKDEVARDLPPRTDATVPVDLSPGQQALYQEMLLLARNRVQGFLKDVGLQRAHIGILAELLRLRQVCLDPRLLKLPPGTRLPPSAKLDAFAEIVRELVGEGHRALVFSQFTEMLGHLAQWADEEGLRYEYLDGETKNRQERIDRFNAKDGPPLFFISLKAGGTGLNLTGADYVIHFDPWWNPAVEQQAIDRVHRIGQTKPVVSYKLIARGTVEEKIVALQERKRVLAQGVIGTDGAVGKMLTEKEVRDLFA